MISIKLDKTDVQLLMAKRIDSCSKSEYINKQSMTLMEDIAEGHTFYNFGEDFFRKLPLIADRIELTKTCIYIELLIKAALEFPEILSLSHREVNSLVNLHTFAVQVHTQQLNN